MISYNLEHVYHHEEISDKNSHCGEADVNQAGMLLPKWKAADLLSIWGLWVLERMKETWSSRIASAMSFGKTHLTRVPVRRSPLTEMSRKGFNHIFSQCWSVPHCSSFSRNLLGKTPFLTPEQHVWVKKWKVNAENPVSPQEIFYCQKWTGTHYRLLSHAAQ